MSQRSSEIKDPFAFCYRRYTSDKKASSLLPGVEYIVVINFVACSFVVKFVYCVLSRFSRVPPLL